MTVIVVIEVNQCGSLKFLLNKMTIITKPNEITLNLFMHYKIIEADTGTHFNTDDHVTKFDNGYVSIIELLYQPMSVAKPILSGDQKKITVHIHTFTASNITDLSNTSVGINLIQASKGVYTFLESPHSIEKKYTTSRSDVLIKLLVRRYFSNKIINLPMMSKLNWKLWTV